MKYPALFVNHGGGPLPLLGRQPQLAQNLKTIVQRHLPPTPPKAIVIISGHWEASPIGIASNLKPAMDYDYSGFPNECYQYQYNAPGDPQLAQKILGLLKDADLPGQLDEKRGFDHGVFVPLMLMFPEAEIPVVPVSLHPSLRPEIHFQLGQALAPLRDEGVLILGSGSTYHNMSGFFNSTPQKELEWKAFNQWLNQSVLKDKHLLKDWESAPGARECHPREDHLAPLFVVAGAGGTPQQVYQSNDQFPPVSDFLFA